MSNRYPFAYKIKNGTQITKTNEKNSRYPRLLFFDNGFIFYHLRCFGVTQNPIYLPNISRVCASSPGIAPKAIMVNGTRTHCNTMEKLENLPLFFGRTGRNVIKTIEDMIRPSIATIIIFLVRIGRLYESTVSLNRSPPRITGNQPRRKIIIGFVASDQKPSTCTDTVLNFVQNGMCGFFMKPNSMYGRFSTPYVQRRSCLYTCTTVPQNVGARFASMDTGY